MDKKSVKPSTFEYDSSFEDDFDEVLKRRRLPSKPSSSFPEKASFPKPSLASRDGFAKQDYRLQFNALSAYDKHVLLINQYFLYHPGSTKFLKRDESKDKRDIDVIKENYQFIWEGIPTSWGEKIAKKYYDKLFKEYCICDLSRYKEGKVGMRWRSEYEVKDGKGQFICGEKRCEEKENLRSWEMNFAYVEHGIKKNALIKLRLCHDCSYKVNYRYKRREVTKSKKKSLKRLEKKSNKCDKSGRVDVSKANTIETEDLQNDSKNLEAEENVWKLPAQITEEKNREDEFDEYLDDLFI